MLPESGHLWSVANVSFWVGYLRTPAGQFQFHERDTVTCQLGRRIVQVDEQPAPQGVRRHLLEVFVAAHRGAEGRSKALFGQGNERDSEHDQRAQHANRFG